MAPIIRTIIVRGPNATVKNFCRFDKLLLKPIIIAAKTMTHAKYIPNQIMLKLFKCLYLPFYMQLFIGAFATRSSLHSFGSANCYFFDRSSTL